MTDAPISADEFAGLMAPLWRDDFGSKLAVAVSGGADSMALMLLAHDWAGRSGREVIALTVDHRLRPAAAEEAAKVAIWADRRGITHKTLRWDAAKPATGLQAAARDARYRLLIEECRKSGCRVLLLAHHLQDQAETLFMRLMHGSGTDGLAAIPPQAERGELRILRPLLTVRRERLRVTLRQANQEWIEDASNSDEKFERTVTRRLLGDLDSTRPVYQRLATAAGRLSRARAALDHYTGEFLSAHVDVRPEGTIALPAEALGAVPEEIALRALGRAIDAVSGAELPPRLNRLERLATALIGGAEGTKRSLAGAIAERRAGTVEIWRENRHLEQVRFFDPGSEAVWDRRFAVILAASDGKIAGGSVSVGALGSAGWRQISDEVRQQGITLPRAAVRPTLVALYRQAELLAVPALGYINAALAVGIEAVTTEFIGARKLNINLTGCQTRIRMAVVAK